jgi:hypothetical protein
MLFEAQVPDAILIEISRHNDIFLSFSCKNEARDTVTLWWCQGTAKHSPRRREIAVDACWYHVLVAVG